MPLHWTMPRLPEPAMAAPATPPTSAWELDEGSTSHQVSRFQQMAPASPAMIIASVTSPGLMIPLPIVDATLIDANAPAKFSRPARMTAGRGEMQRVVTDVAIA